MGKPGRTKFSKCMIAISLFAMGAGLQGCSGVGDLLDALERLIGIIPF